MECGGEIDSEDRESDKLNNKIRERKGRSRRSRGLGERVRIHAVKP